MDVVLLGTGSADGWPNPFCDCASCAAARSNGEVRGHTAALVDGRVLIDCGPDVPRAAERFRAPLHDVGLLLLTHAHPDHVHGLAMLAHQWSHRGAPLTIAGPAEALRQVDEWIAPDGPVLIRALEVGDALDWNGYTIVAMEATHVGALTSTALLYDVTAPDGGSLLYASDTGPLTEPTWAAVTGRAFDVVLLEETFGDRTGHQTDHHDLDSFASTADGLRSLGSIADHGRLVAVHLSHHNPPAGELAARLAALGAELLPDGARIHTANPSIGATRTLLLGGARSGKSTLAERLVASRTRVTYVATATVTDSEMAHRIEEHRVRRPSHWLTVETADVEKVLDTAAAGDVVLVDCLTMWLARALDDSGAWQTNDTSAVRHRIDELTCSWRDTAADVVGVSNEVGSGVVPSTVSGRVFRDLQGHLNASLASVSDDVRLVVAGRSIR
ncbi:MAG: bifunctional adenosylcobinamide kinase/adenosylcobinamide-phosphate guanylyltransferase, partial [Actinomycetes bacterium]